MARPTRGGVPCARKAGALVGARPLHLGTRTAEGQLPGQVRRTDVFLFLLLCQPLRYRLHGFLKIFTTWPGEHYHLFLQIRKLLLSKFESSQNHAPAVYRARSMLKSFAHREPWGAGTTCTAQGRLWLCWDAPCISSNVLFWSVSAEFLRSLGQIVLEHSMREAVSREPLDRERCRGRSWVSQSLIPNPGGQDAVPAQGRGSAPWSAPLCMTQ